jgi:hypothetical protein
MQSRTLIATLAILSAALNGFAHPAADEMAAAAAYFLAALPPEQQAKARFQFTDAERENWHFVPRKRLGLPVKEMTPAQRALAHALLATGLSQRGYVKAATIMSLEQILYDMEKQSPRRDPELYFFSIFGTPNPRGPWGWRVEGHHLSANFTINDGRVLSATPSFFGSNPAVVPDGPRKGQSPLANEDDLGRELARSFTEKQRKAAVIAEVAPKDIVTSNLRRVSPLAPAGLAAAQMTPRQRALLERIVKEFLHRVRPDVADDNWAAIQKAGFDKISFAWAGGLDPGQGRYYRVQGPTFLLEMDNTQNKANHVHSVWRDFEKDFGGDPLRQHYEQAPHW